MGNRKKDFKELTILSVLSVITIGIMVYSLLTDERTWFSLIVCSVFILGSILFPTMCLIEYRKKYFASIDKDKEAAKQKKRVVKRKRQLAKGIKGKDMCEVCGNYVAESNLSYAVIVVIIFGILSFVFAVQSAEYVYRMVCSLLNVSAEEGLALLPVLVVVACYCVIPVLAGIIAYIYFRTSNQAVKMLKEFMACCGYDPASVNDDFMIGTKHQLAQGLLHIGMDFVVLCAKEGCVVCKVREVAEAKKKVKVVRKVRHGMEDEFRYYYITFRTESAIYEANCLNELAVDLILEDFAEHGIFERLAQE